MVPAPPVPPRPSDFFPLDYPPRPSIAAVLNYYGMEYADYLYAQEQEAKLVKSGGKLVKSPLESKEVRDQVLAKFSAEIQKKGWFGLFLSVDVVLLGGGI